MVLSSVSKIRMARPSAFGTDNVGGRRRRRQLRTHASENEHGSWDSKERYAAAARCRHVRVRPRLTSCGSSNGGRSVATSTTVATASTTTAVATTVAARRLTDCPGGAPPRRFALIPEPGKPLPSFPTAEAAAASYAQSDNWKSYQL